LRDVVPEFRVKMVRFESGERFPLVLDRRARPLRDPVFFFRTQRSYATNTLEGKARTVAMVYSFLDAHGIDLRERLRQGRVLDGDEASDLTDHLRTIGRRTETIRARGRSKHPEIFVPEIVGAHEWNHRRWRAVEYLAWLAKRIRDELGLTAIERASVSDELLRLESLVKEKRRPPNNPPPVALSGKQGILLLETILPLAAANPFPENLRFRNFVLVYAYFETGLRKSELLGLKTEDLSQPGEPPTLKLKRRPNDPEEIRARPPGLKTMPRTVPITPVLHALLAHYVSEDRRKTEFPLRKRGDKTALRRFKSHRFMFVSATGTPLSPSGVQKIFETLRMRTPGLPVNLSPHALRRTWNDTFTELGQERLGPRGTQIREYLMGWVMGSRQPGHYARLSTQRAAATAVREMQSEWIVRWKEAKR
jgi:integrase